MELHELAKDLERRVEERTAEREEAIAQLHEARSWKRSGQLTGGVAHDFNNLLTPITGALDLLQPQYADTDPRMADCWATRSSRPTAHERWSSGCSASPAGRRCRPKPSTSFGSRGMRDLIASSVGPAIEIRSSRNPSCRMRSSILTSLSSPSSTSA